MKEQITNFLENKSYNIKTELCELMLKFGSDKSKPHAHNYTTIYHNLFNSFKFNQLNILEIGMGTNKHNHPSSMNGHGNPGGSLYGWSEFFPNANIFGADNDTDILFQTDRIKTFYCDQWIKETVDDMLSSNELKNIEFDIIIDDGLHDLNCNLPFLDMLIHKVKKGGYYIIEDIDSVTQGELAVKFVNENKNRFEYIEYIKLPIFHSELPTDILHNIDANCIILIKK